MRITTSRIKRLVRTHRSQIHVLSELADKLRAELLHMPRDLTKTHRSMLFNVNKGVEYNEAQIHKYFWKRANRKACYNGTV